MHDLTAHTRRRGECPYEAYVGDVFASGRKADAAKIRAYVDRFREHGSQRLVAMQAAEKMNDVWQLRPGRHRIFYFWDDSSARYVLLSGFLKQSRRTPAAEIERAEALRTEYLTMRGGRH